MLPLDDDGWYWSGAWDYDGVPLYVSEDLFDYDDDEDWWNEDAVLS